MNRFRQYQVFELTRDLNPVIKKGMRGVILEVLDSNTYMVEFVKEGGYNYEYDGQGTFEINTSDIHILNSN